MRESVIYQEILEEGILQGLQQGLQQAQQRETALLTRQLNRRIGAIAPEMLEQIQALSIEELENLGEALLDFSSTADLANWLQEHQP